MTTDNNDVSFLVESIVSSLDYDLWKELYCYTDDGDDPMVKELERVVTNWLIEKGYVD